MKNNSISFLVEIGSSYWAYGMRMYWKNEKQTKEFNTIEEAEQYYKTIKLKEDNEYKSIIEIETDINDSEYKSYKIYLSKNTNRRCPQHLKYNRK